MENELCFRKKISQSVTNSRAHQCMANYYGVVMSHQYRHLETTKRQLLNYSIGIKMSREIIEGRISDINGKVEDVRYICLIKN